MSWVRAPPIRRGKVAPCYVGGKRYSPTENDNAEADRAVYD